jgi:hypothetical protein
MKSNYQIPFDKDGNLWDYPSYDESENVWKDNYTFIGRLNVLGFERGRSAAHLIVTDDSGHEYQMFLTSFKQVLLTRNITKGEIEESEWTFIKKGCNYGICLA